ncbi:MAG: hypothetical protein ACAH95_03220 [Fimbriimonas sp.]
MPDPERSWSGGAIPYGSLGERVEWQMVLEHYYWDRLPQAYETALTLGAGLAGQGLRLYRMVEAEHITRMRGELLPVNDWMDLETLPEEGERTPELVEGIVAACDAVAEKLGWQHGPKVLVSILSDETDAPWTMGRYGYMVDKYPFDKICLPLQATLDPTRLREVVAHEYAHVISLNLSAGKVPRWLDEAIAMNVEPTREPSPFPSDREWLSPQRLEGAFSFDQGDPRLWWAYQQSATIGGYLVALAGTPKLGDLLRAFANNSGWTELKMAITGQSREDEALREVYGFGVAELFENSRGK